MDPSQPETAWSIACRTMLIPEAARGNDNTLWVTLGSSIRNLSLAYTIGPPQESIQRCEREIRHTWYLFILAAKNTDADHPAQDRLTALILRARELGVLRREVEDLAYEALTADGRIWTDLPFMVMDVQEAWKGVLHPSEALAQRCNFAAAIARLAGLGVLDEAFSGCGLAVMSLALETLGDQHSSTQMGLQLLPVVQVWLRYAGDKMLRLSLVNHLSDESAWCAESGSSSGELAREVGIETVGFSKDRFVFWKNKLSELKSKDNIDDNVKEVAVLCSRNIDIVWNSVFGWREDFYHD